MGNDPLGHYSETASRSAGVVIGSYSSSFGLACWLLGARDRGHIENIYALVRVADEVVDGAAAAAGLDAAGVCWQLDNLEQETERAMETGYSTNMVVHAFALTARETGIHTGLTRPFFASMRTDVAMTEHSASSLAEYIRGSAEVVGLMCLKVFQSMEGATAGRNAELEHAAASLGAAFQKVNFLRDLGADSSELGRHYFPGLEPSRFSEAHKAALLLDIRQDLAAARAGLDYLAPPARRAVRLAHDLFLALVERIERVPAAQLVKERVRVPGWQKACIGMRAFLGPGRPVGHSPVKRAVHR